jgi:carbonic anhydrase
LEILKPSDKPSEVKDVVITCMDYRFQETMAQLLKEEHGVDILQVDRLSIGGASKAVADGIFTPSLQIASKKHYAKNVYLFDHTDCGGFGGLEAFDNDELKEAKAHFESIDRAHEVFQKVLPGLVVVSYVLGLDGKPIER